MRQREAKMGKYGSDEMETVMGKLKGNCGDGLTITFHFICEIECSVTESVNDFLNA